MDQTQRISVPCDFAFIMVQRGGTLINDFFNSFIRGNDSFNRVAPFYGLDDREFLQRGKEIRIRVFLLFFHTPQRVDSVRKRHKLHRNAHVAEKRIIISFHNLPAF